jgi:hypothetical protein
LGQTSDPSDAHYHDGLACGFVLSRFRDLDHLIRVVGANGRAPEKQ